MIEKLKTIYKTEKRKGRPSKWREGVFNEAIDRLDSMDEGQKINWYTLLNGALWQDKQATFENILNACSKYAWGGCGICYNVDVANTFCSKSQAYYKNGNFKEQPNNREQWLDLYARAIYQAFSLIMRHFENEIIED